MMWRLSIYMQLVLLLHCVVGYLNVHTPVEHSCDFEISFCGWFNSDKDNLDWARHQGLTPTRRGGKILTGPLADHTLGNSSGFYLYMETSTHKSGQYSDFISEIDSDIHGARLSFWYYMHGLSMGKLGVIVWIISDPYPGRDAQPIWLVSGDEGDKWWNASINIPPQQKDFKIIIRAFVGGSGTSDVAIDDVTTGPRPETTTPAPTTTPVPGSVKTLSKCDFQNDLCMWSNMQSAKIKWKRNKGLTPTRKEGAADTGPRTDHTLQSDQGYYLYMETSAHMQADTADLVTVQTFNSPVKVSFWYCMHGDTMGTLQVQLIDGHRHPVLWSVQGDKGDKWLPAYVDVPANQSNPYKLMIRAIEGKAGTSDVAIDDVIITQIVDVNSTALAPSQSPTGSPQDGSLPKGANSTWTGILFQCNFDVGSDCGWTHPKSEIMPWLFRSDETPTQGTGANRDHTSGEGQFAYIETSVQGGKVLTPQTTAVLTSPVLAVTLECPVVLTFWYNMYGATTGWLRIRIHGDSQNSLWSRHQQQSNNGDLWKKAEVPIPRDAVLKPFRINFEATRGTQILGDISIDDVVISQSCADTGDKPPGAAQEKVLFYCDFENSCDFTQSKTDNFDWSLNHGSTLTRDTGPDVDRTRGDQTGHYLYIETSSVARAPISPSENQGDTAVLQGPVLPDALLGCHYRLVFFYSMFGKETGSLSVKMKGSSSLLWSRSGEQSPDGKSWAGAVVMLPTGSSSQFEIIGVRGDGFHGDIAIDDVSVELLCPDKTTPALTTGTPKTSSPSTISSTSSSTLSTRPTTFSTTSIVPTPSSTHSTTDARTTSTPKITTTSTTATTTTTSTTTITTPTTTVVSTKPLKTTKQTTNIPTTTTTATTTAAAKTTTKSTPSTLTTATTKPTPTKPITTTITTTKQTPTTPTLTTTTTTPTPTTPTKTAISTTKPTTIKATKSSKRPSTTTMTTTVKSFPTILTKTTTESTTATKRTTSSSTTTTEKISTLDASSTPETTETSETSTTMSQTSTTTSTTSTSSSSIVATASTPTLSTATTSPTTIIKALASSSPPTVTSSSTKSISTPSTVSAKTSTTSNLSSTTPRAVKSSATTLTTIKTSPSSRIPSHKSSSSPVKQNPTQTSATRDPLAASSTTLSKATPSSTKQVSTTTIQTATGNQKRTSHFPPTPAGPLPGEHTKTTPQDKDASAVHGKPTTALPGPGSTDALQQQHGDSKDSTPIIAGAAGGAVALLLLGSLLVWRNKRKPSQKGRTIPVDDNLSYNSLDNGLEFDNVGYDQFIHPHMERQISERDSGLGDVDTASIQPKITETGASVV